MTALALVSGKVWKSPESRTSAKSGKPFTTATVRESAGDLTTWWDLVAFGAEADELLRLDQGDAVSVSGPFTVEAYVKDGEARLRRKIVADRIVAPRLGERKQVGPREPPRLKGPPPFEGYPDPGPDDDEPPDLPF